LRVFELMKSLGLVSFMFAAITYSTRLCVQPYKRLTTKEIRIRFDFHFGTWPDQMSEITWWEFVSDCAWPNCPGALCSVRHHCNNESELIK